MSPAEFQEAASPSPSSFGFSIFSRRRDQVHSMEANCPDVEAFQKQIAERFHTLAAAESDDLLSIPWIRKLLDTFLCCQEEFRAIVFGNRSSMNRPPMDKHITDFFDRSVKALDVCNAIRDGIEQIRQWQKHLEIVICALDNQRGIGEGQFRRAKKALSDLCIAMLDEKESQSALGHRNWSFGRQNVPKEPPPRSFSQFRSLSWSVSRSWSAARQLQAINSNLAVPKANEVAATHGLSMAVFTMNYVLLFVMWALVAAIPCQDRGLQTQFSVTRQLIWGAPILSLHEKILEESKKRERKNACGLLKEIYDVEKCARNMSELADSMQFPLTEDKEKEVKDMVKEVVMVNEALKDGLDPLERRVREVFHRIVQCRNEGLDSMRS